MIAPASGTLDSMSSGMRALARSQELLTLDAGWTFYVENLDFADVVALEHELRQLVPLVGRILGLLGDLSHEVTRLREVIEGLSSEEVEGTITELFAAAPTEREMFESNIGELRQERDLREVIIAAYGYIQAAAPAVMSETAQQIGEIAAGLQIPGDLPKPFKCALYAGVIGAGIVGSIGPHGVVTAPALVGAVGSGALGWNASGCKETLKSLTPHRP